MNIPIPLNEARRLAALRELCILDTPPDDAFDLVTKLAAQLFDVPIALVSLIDQDRQWFASKVGLETAETPREQAFCAHAIVRQQDVMVVLDAREDSRFKDNPLVVGGPRIRFYAGAPLVTRDGLALGTLCISDFKPHATFSAADQQQLQTLAAMVVLRIESLRKAQYMDPLLAIPNRARLLEELDGHMAAGKLPSSNMAIVAVDLGAADYIGAMIKALGYRYVDDYLIKAKDTLVALLPGGTTVYRLSTTRLAFLIERPDGDGLSGFLAGVGEPFQQTLWLDGIPHDARPSFAALRLADKLDSQDILRTLASAADTVRQHGQAWGFYEQAPDNDQKRAFQILASLSGALESKDELSLHYQPKVNLRTGQCVGVEALLRWTSPTLGVVPPGEFIPLAEKTALIGRVTQWVIREGLKQAAIWQRQGLAMSVAMNVSAADLDRPAFVDELSESIRRQALNPRLIELEFTESAFTNNPDVLHAQLSRIHALGVKMAIDDFGTGYSNFTYLKTLAANSLKIDQSFVRNLLTNSTDWAIVPAMVQLAHKLKHRVVAEGIETVQAYEVLTAWGCDEGQGYWIARPMPAAQLEKWLVEEPQRQPPRLRQSQPSSVEAARG